MNRPLTEPAPRPPSVDPSSLGPRAAREWRRRWDVQQAGGVADREERFEAMLRILGAAVGPRFRFLDLGAGTGSLSERILRRFPGARGVALDFDPVLSKIGRIGLSDFDRRLRWVDADLRSRSWVRALPPGRFDAVVSSTALHWLTGPELRRLYVSIAARLRARGLFLNADWIAYPRAQRRLAGISRRAGPRRADARKWHESWDEWWRKVEQEPALAAEVVLRRRRFPHAHEGTSTPDEAGHRAGLRAAGFREVGVVWSHREYRVLAALR